MNIQELKQKVKRVKDAMEYAEFKYKKLQDDLKHAGWKFRDTEHLYETLIEQLYQAQQEEIAERGVK